MTRDIVVDLGEILQVGRSAAGVLSSWGTLTETKKLVVPSSRSNVPGKSFNHVSSPYMTSFPVFFAFIWASQVSCDARLEDSSPSSRLSTTSRKEGIDPVVMAFNLGMVTVGDVAWAVKGIASPLRIKLDRG